MKFSRLPIMLALCVGLSLAALAQQAQTATAKPAAAPDPAKQALNEQLYEAARKGDAAEVRALLDKGADVDAKFRYGATALFKAAERGHTEVVKLLLERGADAKVKDTFYGATAMTWAVDKGHVGVVRALLTKDPEGVEDVLMSGTFRGNVEMVTVALDKKETIKPQTLTAALVTAQTSDKPEIAELLKKAGAQPPPEVDAATLKSYEGKYKPEQGNEFTISVKDGVLHAQQAGAPFPAPLMALDKNNFRFLAFERTLTFNTDGSGKVTSFTMKQGANTVEFKKQ